MVVADLLSVRIVHLMIDLVGARHKGLTTEAYVDFFDLSVLVGELLVESIYKYLELVV